MRSKIYTVACLITAQQASAKASVDAGLVGCEVTCQALDGLGHSACTAQAGCRLVQGSSLFNFLCRSAVGQEDCYINGGTLGATFGNRWSQPPPSVDDNCCELYYLPDYAEPDGKEKEVHCYTPNKAGAPSPLWTPDISKGPRLRSYRCGADVWIDMQWSHRAHYDPLFAEQPHVYASSAGQVANHDITAEDATVGRYSKNAPAVTLFRGPDCSGDSARLWTSPDAGHDALYHLSDLMYTPLQIEYIPPCIGCTEPWSYESIEPQSAMVPAGHVLTLYEVDHFSLTPTAHGPVSFKGSYVEGGAARGEMTCQPVVGPTGVGQPRVLSARIHKHKVGKAIGRWVGATSTEALTYEIVVGFTSSTSTVDATSAAETLSTALETGWSVGASVTVGGSLVEATVETGYEESSSRAREIATEASREIGRLASQATTQKYATTCTPKEGGKSVGLWQWSITTEDGTATALTNHTICKKGTSAHRPPNCSWYDCEDAHCLRCLSDKK